MASSSSMPEEGDPSFDEIEGFDDYTLASKWERFISEIEAICRKWLADGPNNLLAKDAKDSGFRDLYKVKFDLKFGMKSYCMEYFFEINSQGKTMEWKDDLHHLQLSFGVKDFLVIAPLSASGVVLDAPEATKLLSAVAIALSNCGSIWPAFVPVHDPTRKAFIGIQNMGMNFTRRFEADRIGSQVPIKLMHLEGLYELFISKFAFSTTDFSTNFVKVSFTMKLTYRTPPHDDDDEMQGGESEIAESGGNSEGDARNRIQWDDDCPWTEWYSAEEPVKGFELIVIWSSKMVESSLEMAEFENASTHEADKWFLLPMVPANLDDSSKANIVGFASQLHLLVNALDMSFEAKFMEDFVSAENPGSDSLKPSTAVPPPTVLDRVLKDLFHEGSPVSNFGVREHTNARAIKGAPLESLFSQFCLHALWFGNCNIHAIAVLWIEFVREVRWFWEESQPLPRMATNGVIDLSTCLIHQKLHMLALCIEKKGPLDNDLSDGNESKSSVLGDSTRAAKDERSPTQITSSSERLDAKCDRYSFGTQIGTVSAQVQSVDQVRRGSAGVVRNTMLLNLYERMHAPFTQDAPIMTEDMHEERLHAIEAFGDAPLKSFSAQLEKDILSSDMSAFKAANPTAVFEDFIRWHSPSDWETDLANENDDAVNDHVEGSKHDWPPKGRLSQRMSESGNSWRQIWNEAPALQASKQKPLLDPNREGEKILHYLETVPPHQLLEQMVCTAFKSSAETLNQTAFGSLKQMVTKMAQLYLTIASMLRPLQAKHLPEKEEIIGDLHRLCNIFEKVEKLLILAAYIHRKLLHAPRLCEVIFNDYFNYFIPRMGTGSVGTTNEKDFNVKQLVRAHERDCVANLFTQPTANQSWRKVLSMGNLLNGHEPILREIIFSVHDVMNDNHYGNISSEDRETYSMYICGTSNDLQVALSVTSCD